MSNRLSSRLAAPVTGSPGLPLTGASARRRPGKQMGFVLLPVVLMIITTAAIAYMLSSQSVSGVRGVNDDVAGARAQYIAEAGLQHALWATADAHCGPYNNISSTSFASGNYSATVTPNVAVSVNNYTIGVSDDSWIDSSADTQNYGADSVLNSYATLVPPANQRILYRFDIAGAGIPAGATIISAVAKFFVSDPNELAPISMHRISADWDESTVTWDAINADYDTAVLASLPAGSPAGQFVAVNITPLLQGWYNGSIANQGILLKSDGLLDLAGFTSKEHAIANQRPIIEVSAAVGVLANKANIQSVGILPGGISRSLVREAVPLVQAPSSLVWQTHAGLEDTFVWDGKHAPVNFGASPVYNLNNASAERTILIRFNPMILPYGARVLEAKLSIYLESGVGMTNGVIDMHRLTRDWVEGIYDDQTPPPGGGATYLTYDGQSDWLNPGGDYDPVVLDSVTMPDLTPGWYEWDFSPQLQAWLAGEPNYGLLLRASAGYVDKIVLSSSDNPDPEKRPRISFAFACECGIACSIAQGTGDVLLVVGDDVTLDEDDTYKKSLFEAWGYTVTLIDDEALQSDYDASFSVHDVAYISSTASDTFVDNKLKFAPIGVVSELAEQNNNLALASGGNYSTGHSIAINDNTHYITGELPLGNLQLYGAPMERSIAVGVLADGVQLLGEAAGVPSLGIVEAGGQLKHGFTAPDRRVILPLGRHDKFDWRYLNNNGRIIVQRALQWGTGAVVLQPAPAVFISADTNSMLGGQDFKEEDIVRFQPDTATGSLLFDGSAYGLGESIDAVHRLANGHLLLSVSRDTDLGGLDFLKGDLVDYDPDTDSATLYFDGSLFGTNEDITSVYVMQNRNLLLSTSSPASLAGLNFTEFDLVEFDVKNQTASLFLQGSAIGLNAPIDAVFLKPNGHIVLSTSEDSSLAGLSFKDGDLVDYDPVNATATLVFNETLFDDDLNITAVHIGPQSGELRTDGQDLLMVVVDPEQLTPQESARSDLLRQWNYNVNFIDVDAPQIAFDNAIAANDLAYVGEEAAADALGSKLVNASIGVVLEQANLSDEFGVSQNIGWDSDSDIQIDNNSHYITRLFGTGSLTILSASEQLAYLSGSQAPDLVGLASTTSATAVAVVDAGDTLLGGGAAPGRRAQLPWGGNDMDINNLNADGLTLLQRALSWAGGAGCDGTYRDEFNERTYDLNDGTLSWAGNWLETGEASSAAGGDIFVDTDIDNYQLVLRDDGQTIQREADLSDAASATLSFDYRRENLNDIDQYVMLEISYDGGAGWSELDRFTGPANDLAYSATSYVLDPNLVSSTTRLRFKTPGNGMDDSNKVWFDNIQVECVP